MDEVEVKDETGTVAPMTRSEIEAEMMKKVEEQAKPLIDKIENPETRAKAENAMRQLQAMVAMGNMYINSLLADCAATTVFNFEQIYSFKDFLAYQASHNNEVARRLDAIQATLREMDVKTKGDMINRVEHKLGLLIQELKRLQPDHTQPPKKV
jgi:uncharacterized membrane protein